jgi:transposase InsO family protein
MKTRMRWTGRSIFHKLAAPPSDTAVVDSSGSPIDPSSNLALRASLAGLRTQLAKAQRTDPRLSEIIAKLRNESAGSYLSEPRGPEYKKVKFRAFKYRLTNDKVLVARDEDSQFYEDLPVIPEVAHVSDVPGAPKNMSWKHVLLGAVHNTVTGQHRNAQEMHDELKSLVTWWPPEDLLKDCKTWRSRCKLCVSVFCRPHEEPAFQAVRSFRPFYRLQVDLIEVRPSGTLGEKWVMTVICVATRYIFLRTCTTRDASELAMIMLDIILDCGVVPAVLQSDHEFVSLAWEELFSLLGTTQIFSTALRPQSQGIVERSHLDIRRHLAILVEAFIRSNPRKWPQYIRFVEHKLRHRNVAEGKTPYSAVHGFKGSSALSTAFEAIQEIPVDLVWSDWLRMIVEETKLINASLSEHWNEQAALRARKHGEKKHEPTFRPNDLVLVAKPFYEKGTGVILPQCDGPYTIYRLPTAHTALLLDSLTGETAFDNKAVSVARLIRFNFPIDYATPDLSELRQVKLDFDRIKVGSFVCVAPNSSQFHRIHVARVERCFREQGMLECVLFHVLPNHRTGPWAARRWGIWTDEKGLLRKEVITEAEFICSVELVEDALTQESLEALTACGVPASHQPRRDSTLPSRT